MSKPAAALGDLAAHGGTIVIGSFNVLIGGRPAARQGDSVVCPLPSHGIGVITQGSTTVFINGMPAARMLDTTGCMVPGLSAISVPVPVLGPPPAPRGAAPIEGALGPDNNGRFHEQSDKSKDGVTAMHVEGRITDTNSDGTRDTMEGALEGARMRNAGQKDIGGVELGGTHSMDMLYANGKVVHHEDGRGYKGGSLSGSAEAGMMKWGIGGTVGAAGSKGLNPALGVAGEANMMHAKAEGDLLLGSDDDRVGFIAKGELAAEALKGEAAAVSTSPTVFGMNIQATGKVSGDIGSAGGGAGAWLYYDKKQSRVRGGIMGILKVLVGLGAEVEVSIGRAFKDDPEPAPAPSPPVSAGAALSGGYLNIPGFGAGGVPGTVLLGNPTVLIGG